MKKTKSSISTRNLWILWVHQDSKANHWVKPGTETPPGKRTKVPWKSGLVGRLWPLGSTFVSWLRGCMSINQSQITIWVFQKIGIRQNGWFIMENPIEMGWFGGTPIFGNTHIPKTYQSSNMDLQDVAMNYTPEFTNMTLLENPPFSLKKILKWWCLSISHVRFFFLGGNISHLGKTGKSFVAKRRHSPRPLWDVPNSPRITSELEKAASHTWQVGWRHVWQVGFLVYQLNVWDSWKQSEISRNLQQDCSWADP